MCLNRNMKYSDAYRREPQPGSEMKNIKKSKYSYVLEDGKAKL